MDSYKQRKYVFKEPYTVNEGTIPEGSDIIIFRGVVYLNGGMIHPAYQEMIRKIVDTPTFKDKYLKEVPVINNKV